MDKTQGTTGSQSNDDRQLASTPPEADTRTQAEKFEDAALELGCNPGDDAFKGVLRKLVKPVLDKPKS